MEYILIIIIIFYLTISIRTTLNVKKNIIFSNKRKRINYILVWLLPFVWAILYYSVNSIKSEEGSYHFENKKNKDDPGYMDYGSG